jgi:serine/threonine-protein kinase
MVADFGIALAITSAGDGTRMTETGMSLGTPHYMSPEQAMGERELTARTDVYALGAVMYEMLVGEPPFSGPTAQAVVARVVTEAPRPLKPIRHTIPSHVEAATLKALEKLPADRFPTAAEFSAALKNPALTAAFMSHSTLAAIQSPARSRWALAGWGIAAFFAATTAWLAFRSPSAIPQPITRFVVSLPEARPVSAGYFGKTMAISPDGSKVVYVGQASGGRHQLWLREESALGAVPLAGTEAADGPFFSPDGSWVGFFADGELRKVSVDGGSPIALASPVTRVLNGGAWLDDGTIVFVDPNFNVMRVSESGGEAEQIVAKPPEGGWAFPSRLPRNDAVLISTCTANCAQMTIVALDLNTGARTTVTEDGNQAWYIRTGHLVYVQSDGVVMATPFDVDRLTSTGAAVQLLDQVRVQLGITAEFTVSEAGTLMYMRSAVAQGVVPVHVDRNGVVTPIDSSWVTNMNSLALSPDGRRLAVSINSDRRSDIWVRDLATGSLTRLTFEGNLNYRPAWMPDGRTVSFMSDRNAGRTHAYSTRADGSGTSRRETPTAADTTQVDEVVWSRDGRYLIYRTGVADGYRNIFALQLADSTQLPLVVSRFDAYGPALSPDGRWLAYVSAESGREEVYVRPFPATDEGRWSVSTAGGSQPVWANNGRELFYMDGDGMLVAAQVATSGGFAVGRQQVLFSLEPFSIAPYHQSYAVTQDDQYFVLLQESGAGQAPDLVVVLNWFEEVKERMGE